MNAENEHISPWLGAYLDGELSAGQRAQVDAHLPGCAACQAELHALAALSSLLRADPLPPAALSADDFAARVMARLPRSPRLALPARIFHQAWKFAPLGLFAAWAFFQATAWVAGLMLAALELFPPARPSLDALLPFASGGPAVRAGLLEMDLLNALLSSAQLDLPLVDIFSPLLFLNLFVIAVLSALFVSWFASWWIYQRRDLRKNIGE
jgi:hypothetical protein